MRYRFPETAVLCAIYLLGTSLSYTHNEECENIVVGVANR